MIGRILKDKKAGEKYMSIWWFFVLAFIVGVIIFNSADIDIRKLEADILVTKVTDCLIENGYMKQNFLEGNFDIFDKCKLDKKIITDSGKYYLNLEVYKFEDCEVKDNKQECKNSLVSGKYNFGVSVFEVQCKPEGKNYPKCSERYVYSLDNERNKKVLRIIAGSNQIGKREAVR